MITLPPFLVTLLSFLFVLAVLVFVHELGHFLVAKMAGIRVEQFSLGFPPKAIGITFGETEYCISWIPLGGYVKLSGMADFGTEEVKGEDWEFQSKSRGVQMGVLFAGPTMNFLLGFLVILGVRLGSGEYAFVNNTVVGRVEPNSPLKEAGLLSGDQVLSVAGKTVNDWEEMTLAFSKARGTTFLVKLIRDEKRVSFQVVFDSFDEPLGIDPFIPAKVGAIMPGYPAEAVGLRSGDKIVAVAGEKVVQWWEMSEKISAMPEQEIEIKWISEGVELSSQIVPRAEKVGSNVVGRIGIGMSLDRTPIGIGKAIWRSGADLLRFTGAIFAFIRRLVSGQESSRALAGPVAIAQMAGEQAQQGWEALFSFMALLSINLAILNLLPIPMLDGGHLIIILTEAIIRRPLSVRQKEILQQAGFAFLLILMIYVTFTDISRIFGWLI